MTYNPKIHFIPAKPPKREKRVGIYCRVSTNEYRQETSNVGDTGIGGTGLGCIFEMKSLICVLNSCVK